MISCKQCVHGRICEIMDIQYDIAKIHPDECKYFNFNKGLIGDENNEDVFIKASKNAGLTQEYLLDVFNQTGLIGVYNLGLKCMLNYLNGEI